MHLNCNAFLVNSGTSSPREKAVLADSALPEGAVGQKEQRNENYRKACVFCKIGMRPSAKRHNTLADRPGGFLAHCRTAVSQSIFFPQSILKCCHGCEM